MKIFHWNLIDYLSVKLSRADALLFKIRNFVNSSMLRIINFIILSHILITAVLYGLRIVKRLRSKDWDQQQQQQQNKT